MQVTWCKQYCVIRPHGRGEQARAGAYQRLREHTRQAHQQAALGHRTGGFGEVYISVSKELARRMHGRTSGSSEERSRMSGEGV